MARLTGRGTINGDDWSGTDLPVADGGTASSTASAARTALGVAVGTDVQAFSAALTDLDDVGTVTADGDFLVGTAAGALAWETGATARTSLGLAALAIKATVNNDDWSGTDLAVANGGTGSSTAGDARTALGLGALAVKATVNDDDWSGTDLAIANGGTGSSTAAAARLALGLGEQWKSFNFSTQGIGAGTYYTGGYYDAPAAHAALTNASATQTVGSANGSYAAHIFIVASGVGTASGGAGAVEIEVSGTSITDGGTRTGSDTEVIVADITTLSTDGYLETSKKWLGQVTLTLQVAGAGTHTTFAATVNYGWAKYEDFGNRDFTLTDFETIGLAGANDSSFNVTLFHHDSSGWTYSAAAFEAGGTVIADMNTDHSTEQNLVTTDYFAYKRSGLSEAVSGSGSEGIVIRVVVGQNNSVRFDSLHVGVTI